MKVLLVCAGGMSTGLLMKKMKEYWEQQGEELTIDAVGLAEYKDVFQNYECVLVGPQVRYKLDDIKKDIRDFQQMDASSDEKSVKYNEIVEKLTLLEQNGRRLEDVENLK